MLAWRGFSGFTKMARRLAESTNSITLTLLKIAPLTRMLYEQGLAGSSLRMVSRTGINWQMSMKRMSMTTTDAKAVYLA